MNKKLFIAAFVSVAIALILGIVAFVYQMNRSEPVSPQDLNPFGTVGDTTPVPSDATGQMIVPSVEGNPITTQDFIKNGETVSDAVNPGNFVLAGELGYCLPDGSCPHGALTTKFSIVYSQEYGMFDVVLLEEPLGEVRTEAEEFLMSRLGLSASQLCSLRYNVGVPYWVNETFSGGNLGFTSCQGATRLP